MGGRSLESPPVRLTLVQAFRITALAEAASFIALLGATYVKYAQDEPAGVQVLGPLHGLLFIAYVLLGAEPRTARGMEHEDDGLGARRSGHPVRRLRRGPLARPHAAGPQRLIALSGAWARTSGTCGCC